MFPGVGVNRLLMVSLWQKPSGVQLRQGLRCLSLVCLQLSEFGHVLSLENLKAWQSVAMYCNVIVSEAPQTWGLQQNAGNGIQSSDLRLRL